ncbi:MAG: ABC transporter permease, partial [Eggerthellaceae bacterium]|nr:ABC transporter permease [Eggerthellaceae bacterium]
MLENIAISLQGIWAHKMRSLLTMLGIIIGIASIITIVSTIRGTNEQIKENLIGAGNNVVTVRLTQSGNEFQFDWQGIPAGVSVITEETRAALDKLDGVEETALFHSRSYAEGVTWRSTEYNGPLFGVDDHYFSVADYRVVAGRGFLESDFTTFRKVCLLDSQTASKLIIGTDAVGATIEIMGEPFLVVGIVERSNASGPTINS